MKEIADKMCGEIPGLLCGGQVISLLFYADDILIISLDEEGAMKAITKLSELCKSVGLEISKEKSKIVSATLKLEGEENQDSLKTVLFQKYLGVLLQIGIQTAFLESKVQTAEKYAISCISLASSSPDPVLFARNIWVFVALPAILYGTECVPLTKVEIEKIEKIQHRVARYILQIGTNSATPITYLLGGMRPFFCVYWERVLKYYATMSNYDDTRLAKKALEESKKMGSNSSYMKLVGEIWSTIGWDGDKESVRQYVDKYTIEYINEERLRCYPTCKLLRKSEIGNVTQYSRMTEMCESRKEYHSFLLFDAGLGNRTPIDGMESIKECILCINDGQIKKLCEDHMMFECTAMENIRDKIGINDLLRVKGWENMSHEVKYKNYWCDHMDSKELERRTVLAVKLRETYMSAAKILLKRKTVISRLNEQFLN